MIHSFDAFDFDDEKAELRRNGVRIALEPRVASLLLHLLVHRRRVVTKEELLRDLWGGLAVSESSLTRCVSALRSALGDSRNDARVIETVHGRGYRFTATMRAHTKTPFVGRPTDRPLGGFVGRRGVLDQIESAIDHLAAGRGGVLLLSGEAGIGKTRTAEHAIEGALRRGIRVRVGRCREELGAPALWPWLQILRAELRESGTEQLRAWMGVEGRVLPRLLPELRRRSEADPLSSAHEEGSTDFQLFDGVWRTLERAAAESPRILVLDDLHRADPSSLALLTYAAGEAESVPILLIGTFREPELTADPLKRRQAGQLLRQSTTRLIALPGLDTNEVIDLASAFGHGRLSLEQGERLRSYTGGNPFYLRYVLPAFVDDPGAPAEARLPKLPNGVQSTLQAEVDRLAPDARALVDVASVIGRHFDVALAAEVGGWQPAKALDSLRPLLRMGLIEPAADGPGLYSFVHELVRESIYDALSPPERSRLHLRTGEILEKRMGCDLDAHASAVAHHLLRARPLVEPERAFRAARAFADHAYAQTAYAEAADAYRRALAVLDDMPSDAAIRCDLLVALTEAQARSGQREDAARTSRRAAEIARAIACPRRLARAALAVSPGFFALEIGVFDADLAALLEAALEGLDPNDPDERILHVRLLGRLALCLYWSGRSSRIAELDRTVDEIAGRVAEPAVTGQALIARYAGLAGPGRASQRLDLSNQLVDHASRARDAEQVLMGRVFALGALLELGRIAEFDRELVQFESSVRHLHHPQCGWYGPMYQAMRSLMQGGFGRAKVLARDFLAAGMRLQDNNVLHCFAAHTLMSRMETELGSDLLSDLQSHSDAHPEYPTWRGGLIWGCAEMGLFDRVESLLDECATSLLGALPLDINWLNTVTLLAYGAWHIRSDRHARCLYDALMPYAGGGVTAGFGMVYFGCVDAYLGRLSSVLGQLDRASEQLERALAWEKRLGAWPWVVRVQESQVDVLARQGRRREAHALAGEALARARELDMVRVAERLARMVEV